MGGGVGGLNGEETRVEELADLMQHEQGSPH